MSALLFDLATLLGDPKNCHGTTPLAFSNPPADSPAPNHARQEEAKAMKDYREIEAACERAAQLQDRAREDGSKFRGMTYEDGLREALDWVCENVEDDPTE